MEVTRGIRSTGSQLEFLKSQYAKYVTSAYKTGQLHDIELLLASRSINQFYVRAEYLRRFSEQRKIDMTGSGTRRTRLKISSRNCRSS